VIAALALLDGALHLWLNQVLFRGNFFGPQPFPSPFLLQLNQLFTLNFIVYVILAIVFWYGNRLFGARSWLIDVVLIVFTGLSIIGWLQIGAPNPRGLGYISKALEVALIIALAMHLGGMKKAAPAP
jgi:hypothetical protein